MCCSSVSQAHLMDQPLCYSFANAGMLGERGVMAPLSTHDSAISPCFYGCPAFFHRHFLPQPPPSPPFDLALCSQQQALPRITPQSLNSSSQMLHLPGDLHPCPGYVWLWQGLILIHLACHRSAISFSALNVSPLTQTVVLLWGSDPCWGQVLFY